MLNRSRILMLGLLAALGLGGLLAVVLASGLSGSPHVKIDGVIEPNEYQFHYLAEKDAFKMDLHWTIDEEFLYVGLVAPASGWVGFGLMPLDPEKVTMKGADIVIGYVKDGELFIRDDYADSESSHKADTDLGGTDDILEKAGKESGGQTIIEFKRKLYTKDAFDVPVPVRVEVFLAYSDADDLTTQHKGKGQGRFHKEINLTTGKAAE